MINGKQRKSCKRIISFLTIWMLVIVGFFGLFIITETDQVSAAGPTYFNGIISSNTTWKLTNSPYIITGNVLVQENVNLTIEAGVTVKIDPGYYIWIDGSLYAVGKDQQKIHITSNKTTPAPGDWKEFRFNSKSKKTTFKYCVIEYSTSVISSDGADIDIINCILRYNDNMGINLKNAKHTIINNLFTDNVEGIRIKYSLNEVLISNNTFRNNTEWGVLIEGGPVKLVNNQFYNNKGGAKCMGNYAIVKNNSFINNTYGFSLGDEDGIISNNIMKNNKDYGIELNAFYGSVKYNNVTGNGYGFYVQKHSYGYPMNGTISLNNIIQNINNSIYMTYDKDANFKNNWWGTNNSQNINNSIHDYYDDFVLGIVIYEPFLNSSVDITFSNIPPIANAGKDQSVNVSQTVNFDGNGSYDLDNDILNYKWDFGDGNTTDWQSSSKASHIYYSSGIFIIRLYVNDGTVTTTDTCIVRVNGPPIAYAGPDQNAIVNQTVYFNGNGSYDPDNDPLTYNWSFGDGNFSGWQSDCNTSYIYRNSGNYTVNITVSDGVAFVNDTCIVHVSPSPVNKYLTFNPIPTITLYEDDNPQDNAIDLWDYVENDKVSKDRLNFTIIDNTNPSCGVTLDSNRYIDITLAMNWHGDSIVSIQVNDGHFTAFQNLSIIVVPVNDPPIADAGPDKNITVNQTVYFDGSGSYDIESEYLNYKWNFGDEDSTEWLNNSDTSHSFTKVGIYILTLTVREVTDPPQLMDNDTCIIRVLDSDVNHPPEADAGYDQNITVGQLVTLDGSGSYDPDGDVITYEWTSNLKGKLGTDSVIKNIELNEGIHTITLKVNDGKSTDTDSCIVRVSDISGNLPPVAKITVIKTVQAGEIVRLSGDDSYDEDGYITQYYWDFGDGVESGWINKSTIEHEWELLGNFTVKLKVMDDDNAIGETFSVITIIKSIIPDTDDNKSDKSDTDGDMIPDSWEIQFGLDPFDPANAQLDPDGDKLTDLEEYYLGTDPTKFDTDDDGVIDKSDAFPIDPAASLDSDGDNFPDSWNPGMSEDDSTTGLKLDAYPHDPKRHAKETTDSNYLFITILIICVIIILLILASVKLFVLKSKRQLEDEPSTDDEMLSNVKHKILDGESLSELEYSHDEISEILEKKLKTDQMSEHTYNLIKSEILGLESAMIDQKNNSNLEGED